MHRLSTGKSVDNDDGISNAIVNKLLQDMDKAMWYCSLDMASEFLGGGIYRTRKKYFRMHFTIRLV